MDAEKLFKTAVEDELADELQHAKPKQMSPARFWDTWDGNKLDGD